MPRTEALPDPALDAVAAQVGRLLPTVVATARPVLTTSIPVWLVTAERLAGASDDLRDIAEDRHRWHHQIEVDGKAVAYARSRRADDDPSGWRVVKVVRSRLAQECDEAIRLIDAKAPPDVRVRMLVAPAFHLTAFWLHGDAGGEFVVVAAAARRIEGLERDHLYRVPELLGILRKARPVVGVRRRDR